MGLEGIGKGEGVLGELEVDGASHFLLNLTCPSIYSGLYCSA